MNHDRPRLPARTPTNRAMAATLRLWQLGECTDPAILTRVATGLRALPDHRQPAPDGDIRRESATGADHPAVSRHRPPRHPGTTQDGR